MLLSILALYFIHGQQNNGHYTFDYFALLNTTLGNDATARWIMLGFLIAFVIKLPMVLSAQLVARSTIVKRPLPVV